MYVYKLGGGLYEYRWEFRGLVIERGSNGNEEKRREKEHVEISTFIFDFVNEIIAIVP